MEKPDTNERASIMIKFVFSAMDNLNLLLISKIYKPTQKYLPFYAGINSNSQATSGHKDSSSRLFRLVPYFPLFSFGLLLAVFFILVPVVPSEGAENIKVEFEKREFGAGLEMRSNLKTVERRLAVRDMTAPEYGYGDKTEAEIMKERPRELSIAVLGPLTGELRLYGNEASNGAELASDEINAKGGINGKDISLLVYDTKGRVGGARMGINAFVKNRVIGVVGAATGEVSFSATKMLNDNQLIMVSAGSRRRLGDTGPYNFRITLGDSSAVNNLIEYIIENRKWRKFSILNSVVNDFSVKLAAEFKASIMNHNLEVTSELFLWPKAMSNIDPEEKSIEAQIKKLKKNMPDVLVYTGEGREAGELVKEMRKQGIGIPLIGSEDLMIPQFVSLGEDVAGTLVYGGFNPNSQNPKVQKFVKAYKKRFGRKPTRLAALSYDAYMMLVKAISDSSSLRPSHVRKQLALTKDFEGVTGRTSLDETGEAIKKPFIFEMMKTGRGYSFKVVQEPK